MENTQENLNDKEQSEENRRVTFIQRQLTPLLAAISMVSLPSSEDESEKSDSADENSEMDQAKIMTTNTSAEAQIAKAESLEFTKQYFNLLEKETEEQERESETWGKRTQ